jgi:hypothetical protein
MKTGIERIAAERQRQIESEGWSAEHDAEHSGGELTRAAAAYCLAERDRRHHTKAIVPSCWPWGRTWWKPSPDNRIRELEKAGALIAAEIDRLQACHPTADKELRKE